MDTIQLTLKQHGATSVQLVNDSFEVIVDRPVAKGGGGTGLMGGQYLLTGIAGCFCSTLFAAAESREVKIAGLQVNVVATLSEDSPKRFVSVNLEVSCQSCEGPVAMDKLIKIAEQGCLSINTIKAGMAFEAQLS